jgi:uncharacterized protein (DUF1697 family)
MSALKACLEGAGLGDVKTLLSSGNATFSAAVAAETALEKKLEAALKKAVGREFMTFVRSLDDLQALLASEPFRAFAGAPGAKRVVTFLREPPARLPELPIEFDGVRILRLIDREVFSDYVVGPRGPVFMTLLHRTFGEGITTRTWDTVRKVAGASPAASPLPKRGVVKSAHDRSHGRDGERSGQEPALLRAGAGASRLQDDDGDSGRVHRRHSGPSTRFIARPSPPAAAITALPARGRSTTRTITARSCWIPTVTTSKPAVAPPPKCTK